MGWNEDPHYRDLRKRMVEYQIVGRGVRDRGVIEAMLKVPRHLFVPPPYREEAYNDYPLSIGRGQTISQPYMVAVMTEALELKGDEKVLEIGTGSGYQTAVLAEIASEVFTIERDPLLAERARELLESLGYRNIHFRVGDGTLGWPEEAPFDRIIVTAAAPSIPKPLREQLRVGGIIVIPVGGRYGQTLVKGKKVSDEKMEIEELFDCAFVPLVGEYGFPENPGL
ncbi:MAG TPA: protein-L-isoaspartate(D-aspartate) O-methyltransferase [candidate division WOR-3 bacterium]|uniref:Protein-L-isoaspartate O-methyltransferase n=1 Tax=candidate division WOR-3 bacterium TaxID=2052148 RepID=A0A7C0XCZ1_UNCW3|nr:MAG: protein-L-isoaspartate O-methyltransferase [Candidatus Hydrothermae bacterium]HDM90178.1 protein-L-isoaspartate(D-aspartate) O-methyltransferase [candidate division WOR-3 bacterium]